MDPNTNQNIPNQSVTNQMPPVTANSAPTQEPVNPFLDNLNLNKYDDLLADFELKNPDLALKAKQSIQSDENIQPVDIPEPTVQKEPVIEQQVVPAINTQTLPVEPIQTINPEPVLPQQTDTGVPVPQLDPTILTQSFQQFPKGSDNNQISSKASPEYSNQQAGEVGNEKKVEKIVEELKSIENSPEETNEKVQKPSQGSVPDNQEKTPEQQKKEASKIEKIKVYGYQIPQKILDLGLKVNDLGGRGELGSAKTWLYILVGRVIATQNVSKNKDLED